jgi:hypothetical protein
VALKTVALDSFRPDSGFSIDNGDGVYGGIVGGEGMVEISNLVHTGGGFSGLGVQNVFANLPGGFTGAPQRMTYNPSTGRILIGTTGAGTASQVYDYDWATSTMGSATNLATGIANADWNFVPWGSMTVAAAGTAHRLKISTPATPAFTNIGTDIRPKFICRFGQRIFAANCAWTIPGLVTSFPSPSADMVFASTSSSLTGTLAFGDAVTSGGLGAANWPLVDEFGPITGMAATETYILVTKPGTLIIGRRTTNLDIDWNYLGVRYGCIHPRSIVVDGEDIYLWSNCGPIRVVGGSQIEEIGTGNFSFTLEHQNLFAGKEAIFVAQSGALIEGVQDPTSGIILWNYTPGVATGSSWVASDYLDRALAYNPSSKSASLLYRERVAEAGTANTSNCEYLAGCSVVSRQLDSNYNHGPVSGIVMIDDLGGRLSQFAMPVDFEASHYVHSPDPTIRTHWFASDSGGNMRVSSVNLPFANISDFGKVIAVIRGISDRSTGAEVSEGDFFGVDAQGRIDTASSSEFQIISVEIRLGEQATLVSIASWAIRNFRVFELEILETTMQAAV